MPSSPIFWKIFNTLGRFTGGAFIVVGVIFVVFGLKQHEVWFTAPGMIVGVLGILLVTAKNYRPDRKDR